tara:strand:+ start:752 stop:1219 length:468 start_codon:yes stop_codon:yes gene_type:complete
MGSKTYPGVFSHEDFGKPKLYKVTSDYDDWRVTGRKRASKAKAIEYFAGHSVSSVQNIGIKAFGKEFLDIVARTESWVMYRPATADAPSDREDPIILKWRGKRLAVIHEPPKPGSTDNCQYVSGDVNRFTWCYGYGGGWNCETMHYDHSIGWHKK